MVSIDTQDIQISSEELDLLESVLDRLDFKKNPFEFSAKQGQKMIGGRHIKYSCNGYYASVYTATENGVLTRVRVIADIPLELVHAISEQLNGALPAIQKYLG